MTSPGSCTTHHADAGSQSPPRTSLGSASSSGSPSPLGGVGWSAENALAESFNATMKRETLVGAAVLPDEASCRREIFRWAVRYNTRRRHS